MAVLTARQFLEDGRFVAFRAMKDYEVQPSIDMAHRFFDEAVCGASYADLVAYKTAQLLWRPPNGAPASKFRTDPPNPYTATLNDLMGLVRQGPIVVSG